MIYLKGLPAIEARLLRIRSRDAFALTPLPKTAHMVTNVRIVGDQDDRAVLAVARVGARPGWEKFHRRLPLWRRPLPWGTPVRLRLICNYRCKSQPR
jgi:hypothetical protein